jgi:hypothetical protein
MHQRNVQKRNLNPKKISQFNTNFNKKKTHTSNQIIVSIQSKIIQNNKHLVSKFHNCIAICLKMICVYRSTFRDIWNVQDILKLIKKDCKNSGDACITCHHHYRCVDSHTATSGGEWAGGSNGDLSHLHL